MNPDILKAPLFAVLMGALLVLAGVTAGAVQMPQQDAAAVQPTPTPTDDATESGESDTEHGNETPTADEVLSTFQNRTSSLDTLVMTVETDITMDGNETHSTERTVWVDYENNRTRTERTSDYGETITVRNGSATVTYNAEENTVSRFNSSFGDRQLDPTGLDRLINNSDAAFEGREQLDGEETYRLSLEPNTTGTMVTGSVDVTVWLDAETYFPTQAQTAVSSDDYSFETTQRYRNVSLNESLSDDRFTIDIPDDAEEPGSAGYDMTSYESLSNLRANATQNVPSPTLPANYSFDDGYIVEHEDDVSLTLRYTAGANETLTVSQRSGDGFNYSESEQFESVDVGARTGWYDELDVGDSTVAMLAWDCGSNRYTVSGPLEKSETVDVAESIACQ
ncbi:hypothetical protein NDI56_16085 [Haloarcula sp. S1CR25-12]|uniref:DUF4367 domain-containing protein n=1 Tax=Haloarcula saliterrae TaxID=2950534 RepID=A0ABU2FF83_9EURY|nr:DUF4367 domain-containing protein [Haloarcula sp. S1CR25-12]MDS0260921.1 hypothetical protein [Haloarcula sp. S1CR25-12]